MQERRHYIKLTTAEMDALITGVERDRLTAEEMRDFKSAMQTIQAAWCEAMQEEPPPDNTDERDALIVKRINRDPQSPFRDMVDMGGSP